MVSVTFFKITKGKIFFPKMQVHESITVGYVTLIGCYSLIQYNYQRKLLYIYVAITKVTHWPRTCNQQGQRSVMVSVEGFSKWIKIPKPLRVYAMNGTFWLQKVDHKPWHYNRQTCKWQGKPVYMYLSFFFLTIRSAYLEILRVPQGIFTTTLVLSGWWCLMCQQVMSDCRWWKEEKVQLSHQS